MLEIEFAGWFQCRLATDPDPADEPRGVSGFTFALAGEPDLDRIIRFQNPVALRSHGPRVGVFVKAVALNGQTVPEHSLIGAHVDLLGEPKFESRNYVLRNSSEGPIVPFRLAIAGGKLSLMREDILSVKAPALQLQHTPPEDLARRGAQRPIASDRLKIADATGIRDPLAYRRQRKALLENDLRQCRDPVEMAALQKRIAELSIVDPQKRQILALTLYNDYRFNMNGPATLVDPEGLLGVAINMDWDWPISFWMGAWDTDALSGFVRGMLSIPLLGSGDRVL